MSTRGWDKNSIQSIIDDPVHESATVNRATGNSATAYFDETGNYIVRDDKTGDLVQMSDRNDPDWVPDSSIENPYKPK